MDQFHGSCSEELLSNHGACEVRKILCKRAKGVGAIEEEAVTNKVGGERIRLAEGWTASCRGARSLDQPIATLFPFNMRTLTADINALLMKKRVTLPRLGVRSSSQRRGRRCGPCLDCPFDGF